MTLLAFQSFQVSCFIWTYQTLSKDRGILVNFSLGSKMLFFSLIRHPTELYSLLLTRMGSKSILCIYSDGGPDHTLTYLSVHSPYGPYLNLDLDLLVAYRPAPNHSWRNPWQRNWSLLGDFTADWWDYNNVWYNQEVHQEQTRSS